MIGDVKISELRYTQFDELLAFFKNWAAEHPEFATGEILRWQKCYNFVAMHDGKIVGYIGQIPHGFKYGESSDKKGVEHFGWGITLALDSSNDNIRKRAGRALLGKCESNPPLLFAGVGMVSTIEGAYKRRGHQIRRDCCRMYARLENPAKALRYLSKPGFYAPAIKLMNLFRRAWIGVNEDIIENLVPIDKFEAQWDDAIDNILYEQYDLYGIRTAKYLNYKLSQPNREYYVYRHVTGGYIILRTAKHPIKDLTLVKICDLVGSDSVKQRLLRLAMKYYYHVKADGIVAIGSTQDRKLYRSAGMYISKPYPICLHKSIKAKVHISFFDSDLDNLW